MRCTINASLLFVLTFVLPTRADQFGWGDAQFEIEFVTVGNPSNPPSAVGNPAGAGSVDYVYRIAKHEMSRAAVQRAAELGGLSLGLADMSLHGGNGPHQPATGISWFEAAQFANWLNQSTGNVPAYRFDDSGTFSAWRPEDPGFNPSNPFRNRDAKYFLPSTDEWYKAAFFDPATETYFAFPTGSDEPPQPVASGDSDNTAVYIQALFAGPADVRFAGGPSAVGTRGQGGNVFEWEESTADLEHNGSSSLRGVRGGDWFDAFLHASFRFEFQPGTENNNLGFRVASVPEPSTFWPAACGLLVFLRELAKSRSGNRANSCRID